MAINYQKNNSQEEFWNVEHRFFLNVGPTTQSIDINTSTNESINQSINQRSTNTYYLHLILIGSLAGLTPLTKRSTHRRHMTVLIHVASLLTPFPILTLARATLNDPIDLLRAQHTTPIPVSNKRMSSCVCCFSQSEHTSHYKKSKNTI